MNEVAEKEYWLSPLALRNIKGNAAAMAGLMKYFDRGQRTIEFMIDKKDKRILTPEVIGIICEATGLYMEQIIEKVA